MSVIRVSFSLSCPPYSLSFREKFRWRAPREELIMVERSREKFQSEIVALAGVHVIY